MAIVKTCPTCGTANAPTRPFCTGCGVSLVSVAPSDTEKASPPRDLAGAEYKADAVCPDCQAENPRGSDRCVYCDCPLTSVNGGAACTTIELKWPWGKQMLTGPLRIGRDPPAPESLIKAICELGHDNISRSHADLLPDAASGGVSVVDLGSANGTFVDGVRIPANKPVPLKNGASVRFAANLSVTVKLVDAVRGES